MTLTPGAAASGGREPVLGVVGGGQLGRMFVHAAQQAGFGTAVLEPDPASPAGLVAHRHLQFAYDDAKALDALAQSCTAVTTEFENVPAHVLDRLATRLPVAPSGSAVAVCQHRAQEKRFFADAGVATAPFVEVIKPADLVDLPASMFPGLLKTATQGYDGKGQVTVENPAAVEAAWATLNSAPCVLEKRLDLRVEFSVIVARGWDGQCVTLPVQQNLHRAGILAVTQVPAPDVPASVAEVAVASAKRVAQALSYVGVLCVEFFLLKDGSVVANEMAPRPHNSGHYSMDACDLSQFDLQVRTLAGLPLVAPRQHSAAVMLNLLGDLWWPAGYGTPPSAPPWDKLLTLPGAHLHLYGKTQPRPGRKMGHLTLTAADPAEARQAALKACEWLGLAPF